MGGDAVFSRVENAPPRVRIRPPNSPIMSSPNPHSAYALGYSDAEQARLIRQAAQLAPLTERFFRDAGIGPGQRVLELGSGMGDVAMLVARIVGPDGKVLAVERDATSIKIARARADNSGFHNLVFSQSDIAHMQPHDRFDAAVGRFILQFVPDPVLILRSLTSLLRPGGIVAFHEPQWGPYIDLLTDLPLSRACAIAARGAMRASGANTEMGLSLHSVYREAGLPAPSMRMEMILGADLGFATWICDLLFSLLPKARQNGIPLEALGDLETLSARVHAEVTHANAVVPWIPLVAAWSRVPTTA